MYFHFQLLRNWNLQDYFRGFRNRTQLVSNSENGGRSVKGKQIKEATFIAFIAGMRSMRIVLIN
jgi:hypothetical protein